MVKRLQGKWHWVALAVVIGAILIARGGAAAMLPLLRLAIPLAVAVIVYKYVRRRILAAGEEIRGRMSRGADGNDIIDLCPKCGETMEPGHRCERQ